MKTSIFLLAALLVGATLAVLAPAASATDCTQLPGACAAKCLQESGDPTCGEQPVSYEEYHCGPGEVHPGYYVYVFGQHVYTILCAK